MSKFLKILVNLILVCAILVMGAIFLPPVLGVNTTVVDSETMDTNLPVGSVTYSKSVHVLELQSGDEVLKEVGSSVYAYIIQTGDVNTGKYTVADAIEKTSGTTEISLRNTVSKVVLTVPYLGYIVMIMQTTEGMIIAILLLVFVIILFVLSELWKHNEEEDEADEEDIVDDDGEQVEEILDDDEAREALENAGAAPSPGAARTEMPEEDAGAGSGKAGGDTKEVKIAEAPDTSVDVRRGDTAFLMNELASIGTGKASRDPAEELPEILSSELSGETGAFSAEDPNAEISGDGKADTAAEAAGGAEDTLKNSLEEFADGSEVSGSGTKEEGSGEGSEALSEGVKAEGTGTEADGIDWTKFEVGAVPEEKAAGTEEPVPAALEPQPAAGPAPAAPEPGEAEIKYAKGAAAAVGEKAVKPAPGKPAKRFRPVERLTLEEILEHAKKSGAADETQASRDSVTGVDFVDYSELL